MLSCCSAAIFRRHQHACKQMCCQWIANNTHLQHHNSRSTIACAPGLQIEFGGTCHISGRPYTVFRWRPGNDARYKKTIICQEVAKAKNVCQVGAGPYVIFV